MNNTFFVNIYIETLCWHYQAHQHEEFESESFFLILPI